MFVCCQSSFDADRNGGSEADKNQALVEAPSENMIELK